MLMAQGTRLPQTSNLPLSIFQRALFSLVANNFMHFLGLCHQCLIKILVFLVVRTRKFTNDYLRQFRNVRTRFGYHLPFIIFANSLFSFSCLGGGSSANT